MRPPREITITPGKRLIFVPKTETILAVRDKEGLENEHNVLLFLEAYLSLLLDSPSRVVKPSSIFRRFLAELLRCGIKPVIVRYASLADRILQTCKYTSDLTITGEFVEEMKSTPIFREYLHFYRTGDPLYLRYVHTFLTFGKKMDYVDPALESAAYRSWIEVEEELETFKIPTGIISQLRRIISSWLKNFDDSEFYPKHGPGLTAEGFLDPNDKLDNLSFDAKERYTFRDSAFGMHVNMDRVSLRVFPRASEEKIARLKFVPKNVKTMRAICMEPISRMFLQQEVMRWLVRAIHSGGGGRIIDFRSQEENRRYAEFGSYTYNGSTIDLSAASDRVHVNLVKAVFPPRVLFYLLGTRTDKVDVGEDDVRAISKFAPMGSALCFPVQSLLFAAITVLAHMMHKFHIEPSDDLAKDWCEHFDVDSFISSMHIEPKVSSRYLRPRVFGDDIICDDRVTDHVLILLERCGLKINKEKSFVGGQMVRESCGLYAYDGHDVTPLRFRIPQHRKFDVKVYASMVDAANLAGDYGYQSLRSTYIHHLKRQVVLARGPVKNHEPEKPRRYEKSRRVHVRDFLNFTRDRDAFGIFSTNVHRSRNVRINHAYQREEKGILHFRVLNGREPSDLMEYYAYDQWMRARIRGGSDELNYSSPRIRPSVTRFQLGWTPVE